MIMVRTTTQLETSNNALTSTPVCLDLKLDRRRVAVIGTGGGTNNDSIISKQLILRRELGAGNFSQVYEVDLTRFPDIIEGEKYKSTTEMMCSDDDTNHATAMKAQMLLCGVRRSRINNGNVEGIPPRRYALKRLKNSSVVRKNNRNKDDENENDAVVQQQQRQREIAVRDFVVEADLLSKLPLHPNIIPLVALSQDFFQCPESGFMILECLEETLEHRLLRMIKNKKRQQKQQQQLQPQLLPILLANHLTPSCLKNKKARDQQKRYLKKLDALGIAKALQHLHRHNVVYRDLKPANIGFSATGVAKLFDMGLARTCSPDKRLTGGAGTLRYMAPEVACHEHHGLPADVYSMGMLVWQICTLSKPMAHVKKTEEWFRTVVDLKKRPCLHGIASPRMRKLIYRCWQENPLHRPSVDEVVQIISLKTSSKKS